MAYFLWYNIVVNMRARIIHNLAIFAAGILAAVAFVGLYWHSNKDELSQKVLDRLAEGNYCPDGDLGSSPSTIESQDDSKVYFVGCGGFF